jgi:hypothetical protein
MNTGFDIGMMYEPLIKRFGKSLHSHRAGPRINTTHQELRERLRLPPLVRPPNMLCTYQLIIDLLFLAQLSAGRRYATYASLFLLLSISRHRASDPIVTVSHFVPDISAIADDYCFRMSRSSFRHLFSYSWHGEYTSSLNQDG